MSVRRILLILIVAVFLPAGLFWLYYTDLTPFPIGKNIKVQAPVGKPLPPASESLNKIIFGSCNHQDKPMTIWGPLIAENADLMVLTGDNVYGGNLIRHTSVSHLKKAYRALSERPEFNIARQKIPMLAIWDDGDYGARDGDKNFPAKKQSKSLFLDFWSIPKEDERQKREGLYQSWTFGSKGKTIQIIILDTRSFRDPWTPTDEKKPGKEKYIPSSDVKKTLLGDTQWRWLGDQLSKPADLRFIISSIQIIAEAHGYEAWRLFPHQRARLYKIIEETGANGVLLISGDRHIGALYEKTGILSYPLYELTASSLNSPKKTTGKEKGPNQIGAVYTQENYGVAEINWETRSLSLKLKNIRGNTVKEKSFPFPEPTTE